jgi:hypothetical protein
MLFFFYVLYSSHTVYIVHLVCCCCLSRSGDVVLIMCGPLGRILSSEWTWLRPDVTFLEIGSFFDTTTSQREYALHKSIPCMSKDDLRDYSAAY